MGKEIEKDESIHYHKEGYKHHHDDHTASYNFGEKVDISHHKKHEKHNKKNDWKVKDILEKENQYEIWDKEVYVPTNVNDKHEKHSKYEHDKHDKNKHEKYHIDKSHHDKSDEESEH